MKLPTFGRAIAAALRPIAITALAIAVTGCAVTTAVWDDNKTQAPRQLRTIAAGQPASIYVRQLDGVSRVEEDLAA